MPIKLPVRVNCEFSYPLWEYSVHDRCSGARRLGNWEEQEEKGNESYDEASKSRYIEGLETQWR